MVSDHELSVEGAQGAAGRGEIGDWVAAFLRSSGSDNPELAASLQSDSLAWLGPVRLAFDELHRLAGPPDQPTLDRLDDDGVETADRMATSMAEGWEPPPLVVAYRAGQLVVEDGTHRIEALRRCGRSEYWAVVCFEDEGQRDRFLEERLVDDER